MVVSIFAAPRALGAFLARYLELLRGKLLAPLVIRLYDLCHFFHSRFHAVRVELGDANRFRRPPGLIRRCREERVNPGSTRQASQKAASIQRFVHVHAPNACNTRDTFPEMPSTAECRPRRYNPVSDCDRENAGD